MRTREVVREAGRNIASGTTKALALALAATASGCLLAEVELNTTAQLLTKTDHYIAAGGSTYLIEAPGRIDGAVCDALVSTGRVQAAGALRRGTPISVSALPANPLPTFETTAGWWKLQQLPADATIAVSDETAEVIAPALATGHPVVVDGHSIDARFAWPDDGRRTTLGYGVVTRTSDGTFDECWARAADPTADLGGLLGGALIPPIDSQNPPQRSQLNPRLGPLTTFTDAPARPSRYAWTIGLLMGALLAWVGVRLRAVEHAHTRAVGVPSSAQLLQGGIEALAWAGTGALAASGYAAVRALTLAPAHWAELAPLGWVAPLALAGACTLVTPLALLWVRRKPLDHYLRSRAG